MSGVLLQVAALLVIAAASTEVAGTWAGGRPGGRLGGFDRMLIANAAAFVALLVAWPMVGRGSFNGGGLLIVLIGALACLRRRRSI